MKIKKFLLPYDYRNGENSVSMDQPVTIVSIIGKSKYSASSCKADFVDNAVSYNIFKESILYDPSIDFDKLSDIEGYFDKESSVIYLHLRGTFDTHTLAKILDEYNAKLEEEGYLGLWTDFTYKYAKSLLFLFLVSHIIVITHPIAIFDVNYLYLFKALDDTRVKLQNKISKTLKKVEGISKEWITHGRFCSPRVLFYFESCPPIFRKNNRNINDELKMSKLKILEHNIEDQIYRILRKLHIITNVSGNSLFALPMNDEYVFVETGEDTIKDWTAFCVNSLVNIRKNPSQISGNHCSFGFESLSDSIIKFDNFEDHNMKSFLYQHVQTAFAYGFDDNASRQSSSVANVFELPTAKVWFEGTHVLYDLLIKDDNKEDDILCLRDPLDIQYKFSKARCNKVFPIALAKYQEHLPLHYAKKYHETKVSDALSVFAMHARGSLVDRYVHKLERECEEYWKNGRQTCEVLSLTGNPCTLALHKGGSGQLSFHYTDQEINDMELPSMEHSSGVRYVSTCNCGKKQGPREDPFSAKAANYDFYQMLSKDCICGSLESIKFPIFQPSTKDYRAAELNPKMATVDKTLKDTLNTTSGLSPGFGGGNSADVIISDILLEEDNNGPVDNTEITDGNRTNEEEEETNNNNGQSSSTTTIAVNNESQQDNTILQVNENEDTDKGKGLTRQASTTEYLPGMLNRNSPPGFLPEFSSWSLVCVGPSSLYSHNIGLQENAGFLSGTAYLLPWDVTVRLEHHTRERYWALNEQRSKQNIRCRRKATKEFNVKIFVGVEYECPRGHRFMCSAPDKVLKATGCGVVRETAHKVTNSDMPLYFPCPCRSVKMLIAQLMRVHIVTPKAPVYVTLNPKVQPAPTPCPVFITGAQEAIKLTQSAYWILRFPYVYYGNNGPYPAPKDEVISYGKLLTGLYGITEVEPDK